MMYSTWDKLSIRLRVSFLSLTWDGHFCDKDALVLLEVNESAFCCESAVNGSNHTEVDVNEFITAGYS